MIKTVFTIWIVGHLINFGNLLGQNNSTELNNDYIAILSVLRKESDYYTYINSLNIQGLSNKKISGYVKSKKFDEIVLTIEKVFLDQPNGTPAYWEKHKVATVIAQYLFKHKQFKKILNHYENFEYLELDYPFVHYKIKLMVLYELKEYELALKYLHNIDRTFEKYDEWWLISMKGALQFKLGMHSTARSSFEEIDLDEYFMTKSSYFKLFDSFYPQTYLVAGDTTSYIEMNEYLFITTGDGRPLSSMSNFVLDHTVSDSIANYASLFLYEYSDTNWVNDYQKILSRREMADLLLSTYYSITSIDEEGSEKSSIFIQSAADVMPEPLIYFILAADYFDQGNIDYALKYLDEALGLRQDDDDFYIYAAYMGLCNCEVVRDLEINLPLNDIDMELLKAFDFSNSEIDSITNLIKLND